MARVRAPAPESPSHEGIDRIEMLQTHTFVQSTHELASAVIQQPFISEELVMQIALKYLGVLSGCVALAATIAFAAEPAAKPKQDKYTVKVPGGLGFTGFKGC